MTEPTTLVEDEEILHRAERLCASAEPHTALRPPCPDHLTDARRQYLDARSLGASRS